MHEKTLKRREPQVRCRAWLERTIAELRDKRKMLMDATTQYLAEGKIKVANRCLGKAVKVRKDLEKLEAVRSNAPDQRPERTAGSLHRDCCAASIIQHSEKCRLCGGKGKRLVRWKISAPLVLVECCDCHGTGWRPIP